MSPYEKSHFNQIFKITLKSNCSRNQEWGFYWKIVIVKNKKAVELIFNTKLHVNKFWNDFRNIAGSFYLGKVL